MVLVAHVWDHGHGELHSKIYDKLMSDFSADMNNITIGSVYEDPGICFQLCFN